MAAIAFQPPLNNSKYYMNPPAGPSPPEAYLYGKTNNAPTTPTMAQTPPSTSVSPTSFRINVRQLRAPRQPLYIPAALRPTDLTTRPTDIPSRPRAPDTPPASKDNSFESGKSNSNASMGNVSLPAGDLSQEESLEQLQQRLSRSASEGLKDYLGEVTGPPTTAHWKPDASAPSCAVCHAGFTWFFRRHHCRRCGDVVCVNHCKYTVPLDQNARYHPDGERSKSCKPCYQEWLVVNRLFYSRAGSMAESQTSSQETTVPPISIPQQPRVHFEERVGSMAQSEGGMEWSTF